MEAVVQPSGVAPSRDVSRGNADKLLDPVFRRLRTALTAESADPKLLWLAASEGMAMWLRYLDRALGEYLEDRLRARLLLTTAYAEMVRRRIAGFLGLSKNELDAADSVAVRAHIEVLSPGVVARSIRWSLGGISEERPQLAHLRRAWKRLRASDTAERWREVAQHGSEFAAILEQNLAAHNVPDAKRWLSDTYQGFGREVAELAAGVFHLSRTVEGLHESLHLGDCLFRVHWAPVSGREQRSEFIERFQAGISDAFEPAASRIHPMRTAKDVPVKRAPLLPPSSWQPPTSLKGHGSHAERMGALSAGKNPVEGLMGPRSLYWTCSRESVVLLGGGRAALMQLAHPAVAHAIRDHSVVHTDMLGRFIRTMSSAYGVVFGSVDDVMAISKRVYEMHSRIAGKLDDVPGQKPGHYYALDPEAVFWVGATLVDTVVFMYEQMVRPLEEAEKDRLVCDAGPFWVAFGLPLETLPTKWRDLRNYVLRRSESLAPQVGPTAREQASRLFGPHPAWKQPMFDQVRLVTAYTLPDSLRRAMAMELNAQERMLARSWLFAAERIRPWLPTPLRFVPPYHQAQWRLWRAKVGGR